MKVRAILITAVALTLLGPTSASAMRLEVAVTSPHIVVSQVYGGGGNSGATYRQDFVELFNTSGSTVDITGWSVQQTSATGSAWNVTNLSGSIPAGGYFLVQMAAGAGGTVDLPTPDATGTAALGATSGKIALVTNQSALTCGATPNNCFPNAAILDFVGYGTTANNYEGIGPAPAPSNTTADIRLLGGCTDTDNNAADFATGAPTPRNSSSPANPCGGPPVDTAPTVSATTPSNGAAGVAVDANISMTFSEPVNATAASFDMGCSPGGAHTFSLSGGPTTYTLNPDTNFANSATCTVTVRAAQVTDQDSDDPPDNMAVDYVLQFSTAALVDDAPTVASTNPPDNATNVDLNSNVSVTFSEAVNATAASFEIACTQSGDHPFALSGGPTTYTLNPSSNFFDSESCTVIVKAAGVTDQDAADPPDNMAADYLFDFATKTPIPIGTVQGAVGDAVDGGTHQSPLLGQQVVISGVIYQKTLARTSAGASQHGFFIQDVPQVQQPGGPALQSSPDGNPNSSDGIFVFMGSNTTLIGGYTPTVGDEIVLQGTVSEFFFFTQLTSASMLRIIRTGVAIDVEVPPFEANPPDDFEAAERYWERREGMRGRAPVGSIVVGRRQVFGAATTMDAEDAVINPTHPVALRANQYARRTYRDPHPQDNNPALWDDNNGFRIILGSLGVKQALNDNTALIAPVRTYDTLVTSPAGGVYFSFSKYIIQPAQQITFANGPDPSQNGAPGAPVRPQEYSVADYNVENLYDYRDDPFDGCDYPGNSGCPGVSPPFDYVPSGQLVYEQRLVDIATQIMNDLHSPEIIMTQEGEDQDICTVSGSALACGSTNNADGRPDSLQELALVIASRGGPTYQAAFDRNGADARGIVSAFMYRTDRVELLAASPGHPVLGSSPTVSYRGTPLAYNTDVQNPKVLNAVRPADVETASGVDGPNVFTRPPQVGLFRIWELPGRTGNSFELYGISNHYSSTPNARVGQRREQARYNAAIVAAIQAVQPGARIDSSGDYNVYPRPDDAFRPGDPLYPSDQLAALYDQGLINLWDVLAAEAPASAYSYVFDMNAQTLDMHFVSPSLRSELRQFRMAHVNADYPTEFDSPGARGISDHDPGVARFLAPVATAGIGITKTASSDQAVEGSTISYTLTARNNGPSGATGVVVSDTLPAGTTLISAQATQGSCTGTTTITCSLGSLANGASARVTIDVRATQAGTITNTGEARAEQPDPTTADNSASASTTVTAAPLAPPPQCRLSATSTRLQAGRRGVIEVALEDLAGRRPLANTEVRLRGAGISRSAMTGNSGILRFGVRPKRAGVIRISAPDYPGCGARLKVRPRARVAGAGTGGAGLTGRP